MVEALPPEKTGNMGDTPQVDKTSHLYASRSRVKERNPGLLWEQMKDLQNTANLMGPKEALGSATATTTTQGTASQR